MKLLIGLVSVAIGIIFVVPANAKSDDSRQMNRLDQVDVVSMIDDIAVPIHVSITIQKYNIGHAITEAKTLNTDDNTVYQLRVGRDSDKSFDDTYIMFDKKWEMIQEIDIPKPEAPTRPEPQAKDEENKDDDENEQTAPAPDDAEERPVTEQEDARPERSDAIEGIENENEPTEEDATDADESDEADDNGEDETIDEGNSDQVEENEDPGG